MNFFSLALNNIKKKFSSYLIYLFSTIFAVTIFSIFCSMYYNPQFSQYRFGAGKMAALFQASAVAVILFSSIFVFYANKFFIKTRKKEIAIYSLLGMKKSQIGMMLFYENIIIGLIATVGGILFGTVLSRFFFMMLMSLMKQVSEVSFSIQWEAIIVTVVAFVILFIANSINSYMVIYKYKLIELLSASKEREKMPSFSVAGGIISIIIMAIGFILALNIDFNKGGLKQIPATFLVLSLVVTGTVLLFRNFIPLLVVKLKNNKAYYFKPANFISMSQIVYRINANATILSVISILSAAAITMVSATYALYIAFESMAPYYAPFSYMSKDVDNETYKKVIETIKSDQSINLLSSTRFKAIKAKAKNDQYTLEDVKTPGEAFDAYILSQSDYRTIIKNTKTPTGTFQNLKTDFSMDLNDGECYFIDSNTVKNYCENLVGDTVNVDFLQKSSSYKIAGVSMHKYLGIFKTRKTTIVVNDNTFNNCYLSEARTDNIVSYMGLMFDEPMRSEKTVNALNYIVPINEEAYKATHMRNFSYVGVNKSLYQMYGAYLFIGLFLGILFLLSTGSIMYYKQIIEAQEEASRYDILKKTGMSRKEIKQSLVKQLAVIFGMPLFIGLLHSFFAIVTYNKIMDLLGSEMPAFQSAYLIIAIYVLIYLIYYILSVNSYLKIVWNKSIR